MGYFGSKATSGLCQAIIAMMPPQETYIESHLGGGTIMKRKPPALRNSEIRSLRWQDVEFGTGPHVRCLGKGRTMRCTPLRKDVAATLKGWLSEQDGNPADPVFPSSGGGRLSADALQRLIARHLATARQICPSLAGKTVTPYGTRRQ